MNSYRRWLSRVEAIRARLEQYTHGPVLWEANEEGHVTILFSSEAYADVGPLDPDEDLGRRDVGIDDVAHEILMRGRILLLAKRGTTITAETVGEEA